MNRSAPLAQTMMDAIRAGTPDAVPLTDDAVMWHNYDPVEVPAAQASANLAAMQAILPGCRFEEVRVDGAGPVSIARYVFAVTLPDGSCVRAPGCFVVHERDGRIARIEEYMDSSETALHQRGSGGDVRSTRGEP